MMFAAPAGIFLGVISRSLPEGLGARIFVILFGLAFTGVFAFAGFMIAMEKLSLVNALPAATPIVLLPLAISAFSWMKAHTREGRRVTDQIEGLRQYLGVAEEARLEFLNPPEENAGTVREVSALRHRARCGEYLGGAFRRRAGGGGCRGRRGVHMVQRQGLEGRPVGALPAALATACPRRWRRASTAPGSTDSGGGSSGGSSGWRLVRRRRRRGGGGSGW